MTLPAGNIETGLWLESDRMTGLDFSQKNLDVQKNVVTEEFNQRYLNQPYGDAMLLLRPVAYKVHPYRWPTIGKDISHIRKTNLDEIRKFFFSHYAPNNAVLSLTGNITPVRALKLVKKWFDKIEKRDVTPRRLPEEPVQTEARTLTVERDIPVSALYKAWHVSNRKSHDFYTMDLITDLLAGGESGRLTNRLTRGKKLFSDINAYITADIDPGLIILNGKLMKGVDILEADDAVNKVISSLIERVPPSKEMEKVKNRYESASVYGNSDILDKAMNLSYFELLGDPDLINNEVRLYRETDRMMIPETDSSTLYYKSSVNDR
jgi:predicted Zn-dependent peptidase